MEKYIYIVIHGEVQALKMNPILSQNGIMNLEAMPKTLLPEIPSAVIAGVGTRYDETAELLDLNITANSILCGSPAYYEKPFFVHLENGRISYEEKTMIIPDTYSFLQALQSNTVLIVDKIFLLGIKEWKESDSRDGEVYKITLEADQMLSSFFEARNKTSLLYEISDIDLIFSPKQIKSPW